VAGSCAKYDIGTPGGAYGLSGEYSAGFDSARARSRDAFM